MGHPNRVKVNKTTADSAYPTQILLLFCCRSSSLPSCHFRSCKPASQTSNQPAAYAYSRPYANRAWLSRHAICGCRKTFEFLSGNSCSRRFLLPGHCFYASVLGSWSQPERQQIWDELFAGLTTWPQPAVFI